LAKLSQGRPGDFRGDLTFRRRDNHAPMRRSEWIALTVRGLSQSFHATGVSAEREKHKPRKKMRFSCSAASEISLEREKRYRSEPNNYT
jgi:hypothetical protein